MITPRSKVEFVEGRMPLAEPERLLRAADESRVAYANAVPFPHVVLDGLFHEQALDDVLSEFPAPNENRWRSRDNATEKKLEANPGTVGLKAFGPKTELIFQQFNSALFVLFLESLTGIKGLTPDPHFWGGGLHQIVRGGFLKIHADFNMHPRLSLNRRLNVLLFLNRDWPEEYGGSLELWNRDMTRCERAILPVFNRCVIFNTTDFSYHGHPEPLSCPDNRTRRSIALYYYTNGRPADEQTDSHNTQFQTRPNEQFFAEFINRRHNVRRVRHLVSRLAPPIVADLYRYLRGISKAG